MHTNTMLLLFTTLHNRESLCVHNITVYTCGCIGVIVLTHKDRKNRFMQDIQ